MKLRLRRLLGTPGTGRTVHPRFMDDREGRCQCVSASVANSTRSRQPEKHTQGTGEYPASRKQILCTGLKLPEDRIGKLSVSAKEYYIWSYGDSIPKRLPESLAKLGPRRV